MTLDEFQPEDDFLSEISHKLSNVSIHVLPATGELIEQSDVNFLHVSFLIVHFKSFFYKYSFLQLNICSIPLNIIKSNNRLKPYGDTCLKVQRGY